jgi:hypothetical protein
VILERKREKGPDPIAIFRALRGLSLPVATVCDLLAGRWERRAQAESGSGPSAVGRFLRRNVITFRFIKALCGPKLVYETLKIRGSPEFIDATVKALDRLREKAPEAYELVRKYIGDIVSNTPSGVFPELLRLGPACVVIGPAYSGGSTVEYAGALAHEAYHCELYANAEKDGRGNPADPDSYSGERAEALCLQYQCAVLRDLGLEEGRIKQYEGRLESKWWEVPFEERNW